MLLPFSVVLFFHTMRNRTIRGLRLVLTACLIWTGSVSLMRLGIFPGITFWHNFALLGLLMIPVFMYVFLFGFLEITEHDALIYIYGVLTLALVLGNARSGTILPAPELVNRAWHLRLCVSCNGRNRCSHCHGDRSNDLCHLSGTL